MVSSSQMINRLVTSHRPAHRPARPPAQIRSMHEISWLAFFGVCTILVPIGIVVVVLASHGRPDQPQPQHLAAGNGSVPAAAVAVYNETKLWPSTFVDATVGVTDIIFAFAGQVIFVEIIDEMREPAHFPRAVWSSSTIMVVSYVIISAVGYYFVGATVTAPITSDLPAGNELVSSLVNVLLFCHVTVAYIIEANVATTAILWTVAPKWIDDTYLKQGGGMRKTAARLIWALSSFSVVAFGFVLSNLIPFLGDLMGLVASLASVATTYTFPALFTVLTLRGKISSAERLFCAVLVPVSLVLSVLGVYSTISSILQGSSDSGSSPFHC